MQDWTTTFAMVVTLLKERFDVISNMREGISPLDFFLIFRWLISSQTSEYSKPRKTNLFVSFTLCLILIVLGCLRYRIMAACTGCSIRPSVVIKGSPFDIKCICYIYKIGVETLTDFLILESNTPLSVRVIFLVEFEHLLDRKGLNVYQNTFSLSSFLGSRFL